MADYELNDTIICESWGSNTPSYAPISFRKVYDNSTFERV
jgi:hypothetical protein